MLYRNLYITSIVRQKTIRTRIRNLNDISLFNVKFSMKGYNSHAEKNTAIDIITKLPIYGLV